jgi:molecular chaperone HtpG
MSERKGTITVETNDIFPIIKKWLYSEHDIFLRELISNATDAITKRAAFARTHNVELPEGKIEVLVDGKNKTITIKDNGVGMTEEEIEKYIAQLAFSGAREFVENIEKAGEKGSDIIGKFGLGFYSSFMVADKVEVNSLSWQEGAKAAKWTCLGDTEFTFANSEKSEVGTEITLHINSENEEFLNEWKINETLRKFCDFMPYSISVTNQEKVNEEDYKATTINETEPLWKQDPKEVKDEEYLEFFRKLFPMDAEPLFWLHLKVDHPFTLEGILYFPKLNPKMPFQESNIKLYSKQVFVSDNVKHIVPEFLSLLKGVIDSPDIPLNVSRSSLQGDPNVKRISNYVVKKVAEALKKLFNNDREKYQNIWQDTGLFVKYGCISDDKFDEIMRDKVIFNDIAGEFKTIAEYQQSIPETYKEKLGDKILYFEKDKSDPSLRKILQEESMTAVETDDHIDPHFMQHCEMKGSDKNPKVQFVSVDSELGNLIASENNTDADIKVKDLFNKVLVGEQKEGEEAMDGISIEIQKIKNNSSPAYFKIDEQMKRFAKMATQMGQNASFPLKKTLVINPGNPLIQNALKLSEKGGNEALVEKICHHVEDLATISSEGLKNDEKEAFLTRTQDLMQELTGHLTQ